jgi:flagellum-specific peptidoglycan hydrolase FlgJ
MVIAMQAFLARIPEKPVQNTTPAQSAPQLQAPVVQSKGAAIKTPQETFIDSIAQDAVISRRQTGVPASVTIAQAILESSWGKSRLAQEAKNYFGIKALGNKQGPAGVVFMQTWEVEDGEDLVKEEPFRAYSSAAESFTDHGKFFVDNKRYAEAMAAKGDPRQFAREINEAGYATDPSYAVKLISLMDKYNLYRFDTAA